MRRNSLLFLIIIGVAVLGVLVTALLAMRPLAVKEVQAQVKVASTVGINLDTDKLYFGTVPQGGSAQRNLQIIAPSDSFVVISVVGEDASLFVPGQHSLFLHRGESRRIAFSSVIPDELPSGNYSGLVRVAFYRPFVGALAGS